MLMTLSLSLKMISLTALPPNLYTVNTHASGHSGPRPTLLIGGVPPPRPPAPRPPSPAAFLLYFCVLSLYFSDPAPQHSLRLTPRPCGAMSPTPPPPTSRKHQPRGHERDAGLGPRLSADRGAHRSKWSGRSQQRKDPGKRTRPSQRTQPSQEETPVRAPAVLPRGRPCHPVLTQPKQPPPHVGLLQEALSIRAERWHAKALSLWLSSCLSPSLSVLPPLAGARSVGLCLCLRLRLSLSLSLSLSLFPTSLHCKAPFS